MKQNWERCVKHIKKEEDKLYKLDNMIEAKEEETIQFVINVGVTVVTVNSQC